MYKPHSSMEIELANFGEYLLRTRMVAEKYAPYYVGWVRRFLAREPEAQGNSLSDRLTAFLDSLGPEVAGWQVDQADKTVRLYFYLSPGSVRRALVSYTLSYTCFDASVRLGVRSKWRRRSYNFVARASP